MGGRGSNPNSPPSGVTGNSTVARPTKSVDNNNPVDGRLLAQGRLVRITNTISEADNTDSTNQPVRN